MSLLKCYNYDIVCQEVPDNITLALNISGCPIHCPGCHSPWLWKDEGLEITEHFLNLLVEKYSEEITCVCFMGGDQDPEYINFLAKCIRGSFPKLKVAWYSGREEISELIDFANFDFIKLGSYIAEKGGLRSETTNQIFYEVQEGGRLHPIKFTPKNIF